MNATLVTTFWQQRLSSAFRMAFVLIIFGLPLLMIAAMPGSGLQFVHDAVGITLVLAAGMIGQDVSSGVLTLLFARPVTRSQYVLSRWLSVTLAASVLAILQLALAWWILSMRGNPPEASGMLLTMAQRVFEVVQITAMMALLSSLVNGVGDLGLWFAILATGGIVQLTAQARGWGWLGRVGVEISRLVGPEPGLIALAGGTGGWTPLVTTLSISALALFLAVLLVNRKELSYASG